MRKLLVPCLGLGFLSCSFLSAQPGLDPKTQKLEKNLSAEQKRLIDELVDLQAREAARYFNPEDVTPLRPPTEIRRDVLTRAAGMTAEQAKVFWRDLPYTLKERFRRLDAQHVMAEERKAVERLPAAAKEEVARLLSDPHDDFLAARRKVLAYGPACRALVADQLSGVAGDSPKRLRHLGVLAELDFDEARERLIRITESALQKASQLEKTRKKPTSNIAILVARPLCDRGRRGDPYADLCYYNFLHRNHKYKAGVGLEFGNGEGNRLGINFYGGQDNRMSSLGAVNFAEVKKAPGPETTDKWWRDAAIAPMTAVVGHVYLLHLVDARDSVNFTVKFRVLDRSPEEWIIIEWEPIPQEN
jgi:hypothetical protein